MIFTSFEFILFFAVVVLVRLCLRNVGPDKWFLLLASVAFYVSWSLPCVVFIGLTALTDFSIARKLGQTTDAKLRKRLLLLSMTVSLGLLCFFKYSNFLLENISALLGLAGINFKLPHLNIVQPPAISFYTFASLGYVLDVYYERVPVCSSARDYSLFVTFFPKLLSGPITRSGELISQFKERVRASAEDIEIGLSYVLIGAVQKLVIADQVAGPVAQTFASPQQFDAVTLLAGLLGYTVQIYCDFAGYSAMAIGFARILGFKLAENFQMPLSSRNITEFWRRWHITLSQWFRDYLFLPLEMATRSNPSPMVRVSINMTLTMLLCGLWHGASWNYVIWGGIHGVALSTHRLWTTWKPTAKFKSNRFYRTVAVTGSHFLTLGVVMLGMVFFRAATFSDATMYLSRLLSWSDSGTRLNSPFILAAIAAVFVVHLLVRKDRNLALELPQKSLTVRIAGYSALLLLLVLLGATDASPFVYFQF
jgi:alginate O-acetyltransferase complex protein AlgI